MNRPYVEGLAGRISRRTRQWLAFALAMTVIAVVIRTARGEEAIVRDLGKSFSLPRLIAVYFLGTLTGGVIEALLEPLRRSFLGSVIVSSCSLVPLGALMIVAFASPLDTFGVVLSVLLFASVFGLMLGYQEWRHFQRLSEASRPLDHGGPLP